MQLQSKAILMSNVNNIEVLVIFDCTKLFPFGNWTNCLAINVKWWAWFNKTDCKQNITQVRQSKSICQSIWSHRMSKDKTTSFSPQMPDCGLHGGGWTPLYLPSRLLPLDGASAPQETSSHSSANWAQQKFLGSWTQVLFLLQNFFIAFDNWFAGNDTCGTLQKWLFLDTGKLLCLSLLLFARMAYTDPQRST